MNFTRNIGLITKEQQAKIQGASVLVCGVGGMGGVCAEVLVRMGVGQLILVDSDVFEESNFNRQIHSNQNSLGRFKVEVLQEQFLLINPALKVQVYSEKVSQDNVSRILVGVQYVVNGMDQLYASICLERAARKCEIPIVDSWLTPFASVFTMKPEDPHWEVALDFPTQNKEVQDITVQDCEDSLRREVEYTLSHLNPYEYVKADLVQDVLSGKRVRPSLAPVVWLSGVLMANEVFKMIIGLESVGPEGVFYDQYTHQLVTGKSKT